MAGPSTSTNAPSISTTIHKQELAELDQYIDCEIASRLSASGMTWRKLDACFKWRALKAYLATLNIAEGSDAYEQARSLLKLSDFASAVEYDARSQKIVRVNHELFSMVRL